MRGWLAGQPPKPGVLLGCRLYEAKTAAFPPGAALQVLARLAYRDESGFGAYDCTIRGAEGELASGTLKVYEPEDFERFLRDAKDAA
jgi:predicted hotdog family 3-hydroxylacyl-ACP dehydratase